MTGKAIMLPSEAEWKKAARGDQDKRAYPWGDTFDATKCNCADLGLKSTTPVGIFPAGASPFGCLDMAGNVWEWTRSLWGTDWEKLDYGYPYQADDGRENLAAPDTVLRVLRGGSFDDLRDFVRCAFRDRLSPVERDPDVGFRILSPCP